MSVKILIFEMHVFVCMIACSESEGLLVEIVNTKSKVCLLKFYVSSTNPQSNSDLV